MNNNQKLSSEAKQVIVALRHSAGIHDLYRNTLTRISNHVLHFAEDFGMDDLEALETLRALDMIRRDLAALATAPDEPGDEDKSDDEADNDSDTFEPASDITKISVNLETAAEYASHIEKLLTNSLEMAKQVNTHDHVIRTMEKCLQHVDSLNLGIASNRMEFILKEQSDDAIHNPQSI